ncbi:MAG: hypothetical protein ABJB66_13415 [Gemmatimonadaceae bacterium]
MPVFAALFSVLQVVGNSPVGGAQPPAIYPWWYGLAGILIGVLLIILLIVKSDDWVPLANFSLLVAASLAFFAAGTAIAYPLARQRGFETARQMSLPPTAADSAAVDARATTNSKPTVEETRETTRKFVLLSLGLGAIIFLSLLVREANRGNLTLTSHWGGFGGGLGGWQIPSSLMYLIIAITFVVALAVLAPHDVVSAVPNAQGQTPAAHDSSAGKAKSDSAAGK